MMSYRGKRVLVTGAEGFIGSHLTEALVQAGASVTALSLYNSFGRHGWLDSLSDDVRGAITIQAGDVRDPHFMRGLCEGQDIVFHLAALIAIPYSYVAPQSYVDTNVTGTVNVLEAVRAGGAGRLVHTSTSEVYGTALFTPITEEHPLQGQSPYSASKIAADHMVEAYHRSFDLPAVVLRPFNTFGPRQSERAVIPTVIRQVLDPACEEIQLGDLTAARDFNFVTDTAAAFLAIGAADGVEMGRAYNAGTGQNVTIGEMVETVLDVTGTNKPVVQKQDRMRPKASEVFNLLADAQRLTGATAWKPAHTLQSGIAETIEWWRDEIAAGRVRPDSSYLI
jgi:NAD dependent epimerase/dehydratase